MHKSRGLSRERWKGLDRTSLFLVAHGPVATAIESATNTPCENYWMTIQKTRKSENRGKANLGKQNIDARENQKAGKLKAKRQSRSISKDKRKKKVNSSLTAPRTAVFSRHLFARLRSFSVQKAPFFQLGLLVLTVAFFCLFSSSHFRFVCA